MLLQLKILRALKFKYAIACIYLTLTYAIKNFHYMLKMCICPSHFYRKNRCLFIRCRSFGDCCRHLKQWPKTSPFSHSALSNLPVIKNQLLTFTVWPCDISQQWGGDDRKMSLWRISPFSLKAKCFVEPECHYTHSYPLLMCNSPFTLLTHLWMHHCKQVQYSHGGKMRPMNRC